MVMQRAPRSQLSGVWQGPVAWQKWLGGLFLCQWSGVLISHPPPLPHAPALAHTFARQATAVHTSSNEHMHLSRVAGSRQTRLLNRAQAVLGSSRAQGTCPVQQSWQTRERHRTFRCCASHQQGASSGAHTAGQVCTVSTARMQAHDDCALA
jgi:hypothetical protein